MIRAALAGFAVTTLAVPAHSIAFRALDRESAIAHSPGAPVAAFLARSTTDFRRVITPQGDILSSELSPGPHWTALAPFRLDDCDVLWFGDHGSGETWRFAHALGIRITETRNPSDLDHGISHPVLVVSSTPAGTLTAQQPIIEGFVNAGGGLLIHQPGFRGTVDYAPPGFEVTLATTYWCNFPALPQATIVQPTHPITAGCTDEDLSGAADSVAVVGNGYLTLAVSVACDDVALAAGTFGLGRVAFDTGNGGLVSIDRGSDLYWAQLFGWLCSQESAPPGPAQAPSVAPRTWGRVKTSYRD
jgi:hypothetical protein